MSTMHQFDCRLYVSSHGKVIPSLPTQAYQRRLARFEPIAYDTLIDPSFRRLLVALESLPGSRPIVQV